MEVCPARLAKTPAKKLETLQNKMLRMNTGAPWLVRNHGIAEDLDVPSFVEFAAHLTKASNSTNPVHSGAGPENTVSHDGGEVCDGNGEGERRRVSLNRSNWYFVGERV